MILLLNATDEVVEWHMLTYLLYFVGSTIFFNAKGNEVPTRVGHLNIFPLCDLVMRYKRLELARHKRSNEDLPLQRKTLQTLKSTTVRRSMSLIRQRFYGNHITWNQIMAKWFRMSGYFHLRNGIPPNPKKWGQGEKHGALVDSWAQELALKIQLWEDRYECWAGGNNIDADIEDGVPSTEYSILQYLPSLQISKVHCTLQHLSSTLDSTNMGPIAREHVIVACRELSNPKVQVVEKDEEADEEKAN
ncbi:hypothetical protein AMTR_s00105p00139750 [Amborella trichopoda]|uniref:Uncharacterized protein n=1 Tax=Amborella trichopoda TaxID=13333 RepID=W1NWQ8_AMBTC|nr:hypothetical protein AMTR_s00105p00139750 [Amborella trichopoda]